MMTPIVISPIPTPPNTLILSPRKKTAPIAVLGAIILFAGFNAGKFGLDRWVIPFIRKTIFKEAKVVGHKA
jgi:hypothetical protein